MSKAQSYSVLYTFTGGADGRIPVSALVADPSGNLYGATESGGDTSGACSSLGGCGVIFEVSPTGNETVLYAFTGRGDGAQPLTGLLRAAGGNLVGTAAGGGHFGGNCGTFGCGVTFRLDPAGNETVLHAFTGGKDGWSPNGTLIQDSEGNLYGVAGGGGDLLDCPNGCGVVFKLSPAGKETVLYTFTGQADGWGPQGALVRDSAGNIYGTTYLGGNFSGPCHATEGYGCGVVFKLDPAGNETALYAFTGGADGGTPAPTLAMDSASNLYGATSYGGSADNGVIFKVDTLGNETVLFNFDGGANGGQPNGGPIMDAQGALYGTTANGGSSGGVVFKLYPTGTETVLYDFISYGPGGSNPAAGLLPYKGNLYGTTTLGGANGTGWGVVYELSVQ
ncbi:MAG TPA: choice-of-anchor tandem repeat GloVer-containing protein [Terriglobia bacterium]|nr:choice-of-anchor tandem repeat GloVer-containing protein [Terriglobia bacterium]